MSEDPQVKRKPTLEELRLKAKKSRAQIASEVGVSGEKTVYDWERNGAMPRLDRAVALSKTLGVSLQTICESFGIDVSEIQFRETENA